MEFKVGLLYNHSADVLLCTMIAKKASIDMKILDGIVLGVIGGMGPLATSVFYDMIIEKTAAKSDQENINMIILNHATMPDRTEAIKNGAEREVIDLLVRDAKFLEQSGASCIAITCNTAHFMIEKVQEKIGIPIINMIEQSAEDTKKALKPGKEAQIVGIMATDGTLEIKLYQKAFAKIGIKTAVPNSENQEKLMKIIYDCIKQNRPVNHEDFMAVSNDLMSKGCDKILLACTELSVYAKQNDLGELYIDAMQSLADAAIKVCLPARA